MKNILKDYKIFDIDPKKLRNINFFKNTLGYRHCIMSVFKDAIKEPSKFKCFLCGGIKGVEFLRYKNYFLFECQNCGLVSPNINFKLVNEKKLRDIETNLIYAKSDVLHNYEYRKEKYAKERLNYILEKINIPEREINLLDVGCGTGYFLDYLREKNINYKGLEITDYLVDICEKRKLNVFKSNIKDEPNEYYNIITLFDVLEHLKNPIETFKILNNKLVPSGYILAYSPNIHSFAFALMQGLQNTLYPFIHIGFFNKKSLDYLSRKTNFKVFSIDYYGLDIIDYLSMKTYDDNYDYLKGLRDFIPLMQAVIDKQKISNHQRVIFQKAH